MESTSLEALRSRLNGLSSLLAGDSPPAVAVAVSVSPRAKLASKTNLRPPPPRPAPTAAARPATSSAVLGAANSHARDVPLGGLLMKHREAEKAWMQVRAGAGAGAVRELKRRVWVPRRA